jgi:hypothetical protein
MKGRVVSLQILCVRSAFRLIFNARKRLSVSFGYGIRVARTLP